MAIPPDPQPYLKAPPAAALMSVELSYRDGSVSEPSGDNVPFRMFDSHRFHRPQNGLRTPTS
jgi:hypothetical protein